MLTHFVEHRVIECNSEIDFESIERSELHPLIVFFYAYFLLDADEFFSRILLFDSGKSILKTQARRTLDAVASVLNTSYAGRPIRIAGHTDSDPIRKSGHKSNHHLGFERSFAVRAYLVSKDVAASRMYIASYGPDRGKPTKAQSRRVEMVVIIN